MTPPEHSQIREQSVHIPGGAIHLEGTLRRPPGAYGIVLFAHGSGSSRFSPRNRAVAEHLNRQGLATLLIDLLTPQEEAIDQHTRHLRFDIPLLAGRLVSAVNWLVHPSSSRPLPIGMFGASTGAGAALIAAAERPDSVQAVVSRGGRPDLAGDALLRVKAPTLLIVGGRDDVVIALNQQALEQLHVLSDLAIIPGATHLFEEPGALEQVEHLAADWFRRHLPQSPNM